MNDWQVIFNALITVGAVVGPFIGKVIYDRIDKAEKTAVAAEVKAQRAETELLLHKVWVAENLVKGHDFEKFEERLWKELGEIRGLIDKKADKVVRPVGS
jgi:hypothetical protein